jgi:hypothetical protein
MSSLRVMGQFTQQGEDYTDLYGRMLKNESSLISLRSLFNEECGTLKRTCGRTCTKELESIDSIEQTTCGG